MPELITPLEILPHPHSPEQRIFPLGIQSRAAENAGDAPIVTVVGTDGTEDRHGSVINPRGWDIESYLRNPVVLWGHEQARWPAIGRTIALRRSGGAWEFDIEFAVEQWRHMADNIPATVYEMMRDGFLNAVSVSFIPKEWKEREAATIPSFFAENIEYTRQELTEISVVNVGSNRNALKKALEAGRLNEDQARSLGLGAMLRLEMPYELHNRIDEPDVQTIDLDAAVFRASVREMLTRFGIEEYTAPEPELEIDPETKAAEIATLNDFAGECLESIDTCLRGWRTAKHEELRTICANSVYSNMWMFDRLAALLAQWYGEEIGATVPEVNFEDVERAIEAVDFENITNCGRIGKVFSAKNLAKIDSIITLATELRAAADAVNEEAEDEERGVEETLFVDARPIGTVRITGSAAEVVAAISDDRVRVSDVSVIDGLRTVTVNIGDVPRTSEPGTDQPIRVLAPDDEDRHSVDPSPSGGFYCVLLND